MSTSPSWFDQEKFSRLVKKVGNRPASATPEPASTAPKSRAPAVTGPVASPSLKLTVKTPPPTAKTAPMVKYEQPPGKKAISKETVIPIIPRPDDSQNIPIPAPEKKVETPAPVLKEEEKPLPEPESKQVEPEPVMEVKAEPPVLIPDEAEIEPEIVPEMKSEEEPKAKDDVEETALPVLPSASEVAPLPPLPPVEIKRVAFEAVAPPKISATLKFPPPLPKVAPAVAPITPPEGELPLPPAAVAPRVPPLPTIGPDMETKQLAPSLESGVKTPSAVNSEGRAGNPPVKRRTSFLPTLKSIFGSDKAPELDEIAPEKPGIDPVLVLPPAPISPVQEAAPLGFEDKPLLPRVTLGFEPVETESSFEIREEAVAAWERVAVLNDELSHLTEERDKLKEEAATLRAQLASGTSIPAAGGTSTAGPDVTRLKEEREAAQLQVTILKEQLRQAEEGNRDREAMAEHIAELAYAADERDSIRKDYAELRSQFEIFKSNQMRAKKESAVIPLVSDAGMEALRKELATRDEEVNALKMNVVGMEDVIETLKQELSKLQEQLNQSKEETSVAQRGLALSQKALQETRDALREASEGSSVGKGAFENLKKECSTLVQQNMLLQAQHDQVSRELSAAKAKLAAKG